MGKIKDIGLISRIIVERLKPLKPLRIIIFGSYAYGIPSENCDLDLCIVKESVASKIKEKRKIRILLEDLGIPKDILVPTISEYDFYKNEFGSVYRDIDQKGNVIWSSI